MDEPPDQSRPSLVSVTAAGAIGINDLRRPELEAIAYWAASIIGTVMRIDTIGRWFIDNDRRRVPLYKHHLYG